MAKSTDQPVPKQQFGHPFLERGYLHDNMLGFGASWNVQHNKD